MNKKSTGKKIRLVAEDPRFSQVAIELECMHGILRTVKRSEAKEFHCPACTRIERKKMREAASVRHDQTYAVDGQQPPPVPAELMAMLKSLQSEIAELKRGVPGTRWESEPALTKPRRPPGSKAKKLHFQFTPFSERNRCGRAGPGTRDPDLITCTHCKILFDYEMTPEAQRTSTVDMLKRQAEAKKGQANG